MHLKYMKTKRLNLINVIMYDNAKKFGMDIDYRYNTSKQKYELAYVDYLNPGDFI